MAAECLAGQYGGESGDREEREKIRLPDLSYCCRISLSYHLLLMYAFSLVLMSVSYVWLQNGWRGSTEVRAATFLTLSLSLLALALALPLLTPQP